MGIKSNSLLYAALGFLLALSQKAMLWITRKVIKGGLVVFSWFVIPYSRAKNLRVKKRKLPPMRNELLEIPAVKLSQMIRTQQVTSEAVITAYIERCTEVNPFLNAIVENRFEAALEEARAVDLMITSGKKTIEEMERDTPLLGVPVTVKESISVQGMSNQAGRVQKRKRIAQENSSCVVQVKKHGAIILLVSNTPELCMCWETYNNVTGQTRNPYNLRRTPGGSSGGEAALLGAGASLLSLSSDIGGSARLPAMFTGVFGHKPTPYAVSPTGHVPVSPAPTWGDFFTIAPMVRYASDLPLLLKCMLDPNGTPLTLDKHVAIEDIKFYFMDRDGSSKMTTKLSTDVREALYRAANDLNAKKVNIELLKLSLPIAASSMLRIKDVETIYTYTEEGERPKTVGMEFVKCMLGFSENIFPSVLIGLLQNIMASVPESQHEKLLGYSKKLRKQFIDLLGTNGVFLYPTFPTTAHPHYEIFHKLVDPNYMMIFNAIGLPATNCMVGLDKHNLPIGIQIITAPGQDHLAMAVAAHLERLYGGWQKPPSSDDSVAKK